MAFENLSEREKQILLNLITHYVKSADPVGSRVIAREFKMGISSATVRNTLADLEELGLVEQPHTSAGRIPTDLGYRVYVDYFLKPTALTQQEKDFIKQSLLKEGRGIKEILGQTCRVLGEITNQLGISMSPRFEAGRLKRLELIPVSEGRIMAVVVVASGLASSVILELEVAVSDAELQKVEQVLNERLVGLSLGEIRTSVSDRLADLSGQGRLVKLLMDSKDRIWTDHSADGIRVAGLASLLGQPEFADVDKVSSLVRMLEEGSVLSQFLADAEQAGLVITIGRENKFAEIMNCSLVTSSYKVGNISGTIGVVGPTRMPYNRLASVVQYTARTITDVLSQMEGRKDE
ncbi:MAG: heat-inducible transcriptional repressor HrcA [bacterium]